MSQNEQQFGKRYLPVSESYQTADGMVNAHGLDYDDTAGGFAVEKHMGRRNNFVPPFAADANKLRRVLIEMVRRTIGKNRADNFKDDWKMLNELATSRALEYCISPLADPKQIHNIEQHKKAVRRAGGWLELQGAVVYRAWREGMTSVDIAETLDVNPTAVRQIVFRARKAARLLGYDVGPAHSTRGISKKTGLPIVKSRPASTPQKPVHIGAAFGRWTVIGPGPQDCWSCRCACGTEKYVKHNNLKIGMSKSCGCWKKELLRARRTKQ